MNKYEVTATRTTQNQTIIFFIEAKNIKEAMAKAKKEIKETDELFHLKTIQQTYPSKYIA